MCVAVAPARFSATTVYAGEVRHNGDAVHVAGYENTVANRAGAARSGSWLPRLLRTSELHSGGNAMVLHFPAVAGTMSQQNVVDTADCPHVLRDMVTALMPRFAAAGRAQVAASATAVEVFDTGIYTVVLAGDPRDIPSALDRVPERKRPPVNRTLFDWYRVTFPGWPIALCCFDNREARRATPMMWWYEPAYPRWLFAPAVDCHTGAIPNLRADVATDHWVVLGSSRLQEGMPVRYTDEIPPTTAAFLPERVIGVRLDSRLPNGDFLARVDDVRGADLDVRRGLLLDVA